MNDWYIDRSKNFLNDSFDPVINFMLTYTGERDSGCIINELIKSDIFDDDAGNLNAALTRFRDHGIINNNNMLGDPATDYALGRLSKQELIIDLFIKRPARKKGSPNIKPLVALCRTFHLMYELLADDEDVYLSYEECYKYLYNCNTIEEINAEFVDAILNNRPCTGIYLKRNEIINISIWANALRNTPLLIPNDNSSIMKPNPYAIDFIEYIARNGSRISETPTESNEKLYSYYCDREKGINEIIPDVFKDNVIIPDDNTACKIFNYIFGIMCSSDLDKSYYFKEDCFGVYNAFVLAPRLAIRKVWISNKSVGNSLYKLLIRQS